MSIHKNNVNVWEDVEIMRVVFRSALRTYGALCDIVIKGDGRELWSNLADGSFIDVAALQSSKMAKKTGDQKGAEFKQLL